MQILEESTTHKTIELLENEVFVIPTKCWAYDIDTKKLITTPTVQALAKLRLKLLPKVMGG